MRLLHVCIIGTEDLGNVFSYFVQHGKCLSCLTVSQSYFEGQKLKIKMVYKPYNLIILIIESSHA